MRIVKMRVNHLENPLGYTLDKPVFSFNIEKDTGRLAWARLIISKDEALEKLAYDSGEVAGMNAEAYCPGFSPEEGTRYYWRVSAKADDGEEAVSEPSWFETALPVRRFTARWIRPSFGPHKPAVFARKFTLDQLPAHSRATVTALGLYEIELNGVKVGDECLAPGCHAYDKWQQYQTYDLAPYLLKGENEIRIYMADGWYAGRFGFSGGNEIFGRWTGVKCQLDFTLENGKTRSLRTDGTWTCAEYALRFSNIYDGEIYDDRKRECEKEPAVCFSPSIGKLTARLSPPVLVQEKLAPVAVLHTPDGSSVLDMGQNMVGWLSMTFDEKAGTEVLVQFGEILQEGNFFNANLRTAKQEFRFISSGEKRAVCPRFTFYGFRYVKVSGLHGALRAEDFTGLVLYSRMDARGMLETDDPRVNRLIQNALWGQKGNFLDVPTDCPQRDERMGWTGDAQAFCGTALYNMDAAAFYYKYCHDFKLEQAAAEGAGPHFVPACGFTQNCGSAAWADAATIIPWNVYLHTGDQRILENQYSSMRDWVEYVRCQDIASGGRYLWTTGFHYGDWLALDNYAHPDDCVGGTDVGYIASCYYHYSSLLTARAARVLGKTADAKKYEALADKVKKAILREFFTPSGRLAVRTQTAHVLALFFGLAPDPERTKRDLEKLFEDSDGKLTTGFVGTIYLCRALSDGGLNARAYSLLLNTEYPGWLYEVSMGATTIWERWNSLPPDGQIKDLSMNSFNHYAFGSVVEWMYRNVIGLKPREDAPGFAKAVIAPQPDPRLGGARASVDTAAGRYEIAWKYAGDQVKYEIAVPFNCEAELRLPGQKAKTLVAGRYTF